ncbi:GNAT family N-acetyltransferase [Alteromonas sp. 5E99-2]|uniref:GNAT family N-acetyltransferase n=1 Tax=Alteromonas sp. 5E99-2 TaxID=2817683 RepID=UPI001F61D514|nr:GNAT family N-acetyltransferase [Alteromonas sp. 5E99-2]
MQGIKISSDHKNLDIQLIHSFVSQSYWAKNIPLQTLQKSIDNSLVFGAYNQNGEQVGFARVISDKATFAYLGDVFVVDSYRGKGISKLLMEAVSSHPDLQGLRRFMLATSDAHGLYSKFGFVAVENPDILMQIWNPSVYE